jgi:PKD repeat protein
VSADNNPNVKIGFNWTNNDDGIGTDPSFAVDNITLTGIAAGGGGACPAYSPVVYIGEPAPMQLFVVKFAEISCNGENDGAIEIQVAGGQTPYSYLWSNGVEFSANLDLEPGEYTVVVTDANNCEIQQTFIIAPDPVAETVSFEVVALDLDVSFTNNSSEGNYLWDFGDGNTSDEFEPLHTYESAGLYEVCLTLISSCGDQTTCQEINIVSTGIETQSIDISIFPNPFSSQLILNFNQVGFFELMVYSVHGKLIQAETVTTNRVELNTENWNTGLYLIQARDLNSGKSFTHRVVKVN